MRVRLSHAVLMAFSAAFIGCAEPNEPATPAPDIHATPGPGASSTDTIPPATDAIPPATDSHALPEPTTPPATEATPAAPDDRPALEPASPGSDSEQEKANESGTPKVIEEPAAPTGTPDTIKDAPEKGAEEVKKEEPPK